MEQYAGLLAMEYGGNTVLQLGIALVVFLALYFGIGIAKRISVMRLKKIADRTETKADDIVVHFLESVKSPLYALIALYVALQGLNVPESLTLIVRGVFLVMIVMQVIALLEQVIGFMIARQLNEGAEEDAPLPSAFTLIIRVTLWLLGLLLILSNLGVNITSLVAGLGIGGLAISLALQSVFEDIFSSFSIAIDKPFEVGDFIVVGDFKGNVKHIGLKTTRIQALQGEEIVISNKELTSARLQNFKKLERRRVQYSLSATYETPVAKLRALPDMIRAIVDDHEMAEVDRVHLKELNDYSVDYEVIYFVNTDQYAVYMDVNQDINLRILELFEKEGIDMPYPTRTVYTKELNV